MRNLINILFLFFFVISCQYFNTIDIEINIQDKDKNKINNAEIKIYSIDDKNNNQLIMRKYSNKNGEVYIDNIKISDKTKKIKILVKDDEIENLYQPKIELHEIPKWWQERTIKKIIILNKYQINKKNIDKIENKLAKEFSNILDFNDKFIGYQSDITENETNLQPENLEFESNLPKSFIQNSENSSELKKQKDNKLNEKFYIQDKKNYELNLQDLTVQVTADQKALENVLVYIGNGSSQTLNFRGFTNEKGEIKLAIPNFIYPEVIVLKKENFMTSYLPITNGSKKNILKIEMNKGKDLQLLTQYFAYGVGHGFDKSELYVQSLKQDISGIFGFLSVNKEINDKVSLKIMQKNAVPETIENLAIKSMLAKYQSSKEIPILYLNTKNIYKPSVGLVEPALNSQLQSNNLWRKFRREFFSRFMNENIFRAKIYEDIVKIANYVDKSAYELMTQGWKESVFSNELDFIIHLSFKEDNEDTILYELYDKNAKKIFSDKMLVSDKNAEEKSAMAYEILINKIPLEGNIISKKNEKYILNLGANNKINIGDFFVVYTALYPYSIPSKVTTLLKVIEIEPQQSVLEYVSGEKNINLETTILAQKYFPLKDEYDIKKLFAMP